MSTIADEDSAVLNSCSISVDFDSTDGEERRSSVASPRELVRELAGLVAPSHLVKAQIPIVHRELLLQSVEVTERRVRSFFFGETDRAYWHEVEGLRRAIRRQRTRKARLQFAETINVAMAGLAKKGAAFDQRQRQAIEEMIQEIEA